MNGISNVYQNTVAPKNQTEQATGVYQNRKQSYVSGKTIGNPKLSETAAKYYEELKKKYSNMDFILVSEDQKEMAKSQASQYGNANKMVVLIDEAKIEKMATDERYRKQYETIIANGANSLNHMAQKLKASGVSVKSFGMEIKDNRASFFASVDKSFAIQRKNQQKRLAEKKEAKAAEEKKARREEEEERRMKRAEKKAEASVERKAGWEEEQEIISASSVEELIQKIQDYSYAAYSDVVQTPEESRIGGNIDFMA